MTGPRDTDLAKYRKRLEGRMRRISPASPVERLRLDPLSPAEQPPSFTGLTSLGPDYTIEIQAETHWAGQHHRCVKRFCETGGVDDPTGAILDTILVHEVGHEVVCPLNAAHARKMRLAVAGVLKGLNKYSPGLCQYTANLVADILVNVIRGGLPRAPADGDYAEGLLLSWYDQGASPYYPSALRGWARRLLAAIFGKRRFEPYFEVFVRSQTGYLPCGGTAYPRLLRPFLRRPNPPAPRKLGPASDADEADVDGAKGRRSPVEKAADEIADLIRDPATITTPGAWPDLSREICRILAPFLPKVPPPSWRSHPYFEYRSPEDAGQEDGCPPDKGSGGGGKQQGGAGAGEGGEEPQDREKGGDETAEGRGNGGEQEGNGGGGGGGEEAQDREKGGDETAEGRGNGGEQEGNGGGGGGGEEAQDRGKDGDETSDDRGSRGGEEGTAKETGGSQEDRQDGRGRTVLTDVEWVNDEGTRISTGLEKGERLDGTYAHWAGRMQLDFGTRPDERRDPAELVGPFDLKDDRIGQLDPLTSILFCIDTSGSMVWGGGRSIAPDATWSEHSFYHHALLAVYSVANWLRDERMPYQVNVVTFSNRTTATGWCLADELRRKLRETVFSPEGGGTELKSAVLEQHLPPLHGCLVVLFSDGQLYNVQEAIDLFTRPDVRDRCLPVLIHTNPSGSSPLADAMRQNEFQVLDVRDAKDIPGYVGTTASKLLG